MMPVTMYLLTGHIIYRADSDVALCELYETKHMK